MAPAPSLGEEAYGQVRFKEAVALFEEGALNERFVEFLTLPSDDRID